MCIGTSKCSSGFQFGSLSQYGSFDLLIGTVLIVCVPWIVIHSTISYTFNNMLFWKQPDLRPTKLVYLSTKVFIEIIIPSIRTITWARSFCIPWDNDTRVVRIIGSVIGLGDGLGTGLGTVPGTRWTGLIKWMSTKWSNNFLSISYWWR